MSATHRRVAAAALAVLALAGCDDGGEPTAATSTTTARGATAGSGFVAFGDSGGGPAQEDVAEAMERWAEDHRVDALVTTGDNVYDFGEPHHFGNQLDRPYEDLRRTRPLWVTLGNHDVVRGHGAEQLDYLDLPALPYARTLPGVQILFLDANRPDAGQATWLDERLAAPGPPFRVVSFHQPAHSCGTHGPTEAVVEQWVPVFERHRVALVLSGHDHLYQRFTSGAGVEYVVTGGGGRPLYRFREPCRAGAAVRAHAEEHHFVGVEVRGRRMTVTAVSDDDRVLDRFEVRR